MKTKLQSFYQIGEENIKAYKMMEAFFENE